jgi:hypothetical protein
MRRGGHGQGPMCVARVCGQASGVFVSLGGLPFILSLADARVAAVRRAGFEVLSALLVGRAEAAAAPGAPPPPEWLLSDDTLAGLCGYLAADGDCDAARLLLRLTRAAARRQALWEGLRASGRVRRAGLRRLLILIQASGCEPARRQEAGRGGESMDGGASRREPGAGAGGSVSGKREARRGALLETLYCLMGAGGNSSAQVPPRACVDIGARALIQRAVTAGGAARVDAAGGRGSIGQVGGGGADRRLESRPDAGASAGDGGRG